MSLREIAWRVRGKLRDRLDRMLLARLTVYPAFHRVIGRSSGLELNSAALGTHLASGELFGQRAGYRAAWRDRLLERADRMAAHRLDLFDLKDVDLGPTINWHYDYKACKDAPLIFAQDIDYRDYAVTGDCKFVWEVNRHYQLVTLGRAYRMTGERRYAEAVVEQIDSWIEQNPFGIGMNWRSPLELAIRMINWVWALELIRPSGLVDEPHLRRWLPVVYRHCWEISRKYSRFSSANNHTIGEAAGVFVASCYFTNLKDASRWRRKSWRILTQQILKQTFADGCNREQAMGYHLFVLEFCTLCLIVARRSGVKIPTAFEQMLEKMYVFLAAMCEAGDPPMFGDADDGYVLDLGRGRISPREWLAVGAVLFHRPEFKAIAGDPSEPMGWLLGPQAWQQYEELAVATSGETLSSRAFPQSGLYLLQNGRRDDGSAVSVTVDCGELGFGAIAAHGHADALSVTLRAGGENILVDPGTYDYFTYPQWREHFRGTSAHNTVVVDEANQSEILGPFLWGRRANCQCLSWQPTADGGELIGRHDGYQSHGVLHERRVRLAGRCLEIQDLLTGTGSHQGHLYLHFGPNLDIQPLDGNRVVIGCSQRKVVMEFSPSLVLQVVRAGDPSLLGWFSPGYHQKIVAVTIVGSFNWEQQYENTIRVFLD